MSEEMKDKYIDISNFNLGKDDLFGRYCHIEMQFYGKDGNQFHIFKIVGQLRSNGYCDVPFNHSTKPAYVHDKIIDIVNVIECGVSEDKVYRVPLKDVKILKNKYDEQEDLLEKVRWNLAFCIEEKNKLMNQQEAQEQRLKKVKKLLNLYQKLHKEIDLSVGKDSFDDWNGGGAYHYIEIDTEKDYTVACDILEQIQQLEKELEELK